MLAWVSSSRCRISKSRIWRHGMKLMAEKRFWAKDSKLSLQVWGAQGSQWQQVERSIWGMSYQTSYLRDPHYVHLCTITTCQIGQQDKPASEKTSSRAGASVSGYRYWMDLGSMLIFKRSVNVSVLVRWVSGRTYMFCKQPCFFHVGMEQTLLVLKTTKSGYLKQAASKLRLVLELCIQQVWLSPHWYAVLISSG